MLLDYAKISAEGVLMDTKGTSTTFLDPSHFPLVVDGYVLNMRIRINNGETTMTIRNLRTGTESSYEVDDFEMNELSIIFLYLVGQELRKDKL